MNRLNITTLSLSVCLLAFAGSGNAITLNYTNVDPAGLFDTVVNGIPARVLEVTTDDLLLQANTSLTINVSFLGGQGLHVSPAGGAGTELINLAFVSPHTFGSAPSAVMTGTVAVTATENFNPGSEVATAFIQSFAANSPVAAADAILLIKAGNLTDAGYVLESLQYQISVPAGFNDYATTGINLLVTGSAFSVVPLPAALPMFFSALFGVASLARRRRRAAQV